MMLIGIHLRFEAVLGQSLIHALLSEGYIEIAIEIQFDLLSVSITLLWKKTMFGCKGFVTPPLMVNQP